VVRAWATGMSMPGNLQIECPHDIQVNFSQLLANPDDGFVTWLLQTEKCGILAHILKAHE